MFTDDRRLFRVKHDHDKTQVETHHKTHFGTAIQFTTVETSRRQTAGRALDEAKKVDTSPG